MSPTISQLVALWYETIGGLHHKECDCHFAISQHWAYAGESKWFINHTGYLLGEHLDEFTSYAESETHLARVITEGIREWVDCEDSTLTPTRRAEILAALSPAEPATVKPNQVVQPKDGRKYVAAREHPLPSGATIVADKPHADGDYSYCCGGTWCRCSQ